MGTKDVSEIQKLNMNSKAIPKSSIISNNIDDLGPSLGHQRPKIMLLSCA